MHGTHDDQATSFVALAGSCSKLLSSDQFIKYSIKWMGTVPIAVDDGKSTP